jgi:drug/metabolite transporter (DMT)-like permease
VTFSPLFIAILGWIILRDRLSRRSILAIGVGVAGATMIGLGDTASGDFPRAGFGNAMALTAALLVAVYLLIGRAVRQRASLLAYLFPVYLASAVTTWIVLLATGTPVAQPWHILGLCLLLALGPQLVAHSAFNFAVRYVPAALIGLATLAEPVVGTLLAYAFFAEAPPPLTLVGMAVVLAAIGVSFGRFRRMPAGVAPPRS